MAGEIGWKAKIKIETSEEAVQFYGSSVVVQALRDSGLHQGGSCGDLKNKYK